MADAKFKSAVQESLHCLATKGGQMLAQQSGECLGVILAQMHTKAKQGVQLEVGWTSEELEKEVKRILLEAQGKGHHDRCSTIVTPLPPAPPPRPILNSTPCRAEMPISLSRASHCP